MKLVDAQSGQRVEDIPVQGKNPEHAVFSPDSRWLYVSAEEAEQVDVIDVALRRQTGAVAVGLRPRGIGFLPDSRAYIACEMVNAVYVVDTASGAAVATIPAGRDANGIAVHPDGAKLYVANGRSNTVSVIDTASARKTADIAVGELPWGVAIR